MKRVGLGAYGLCPVCGAPGDTSDTHGAVATIDVVGSLNATIVGLRAHISDLTRRLAEAEECLTIAHMDGYYKGHKAGQSEHNNSVRMGQYILEAKTEKRLREAAEARVRELEAENALIAESYKRAHREVVRLRMEMRRSGAND